MEREMLDNLFRYEGDMLYKKWKGKRKWVCCNDLKLSGNGYIQIGVNGKMMLLHRLVYLFHNPEWNISDNCSDNLIDHINGNKLDNRIENLRVVTHSQNTQNITHCRGHPIRGVSYKTRNNVWTAHWSINGKQKAKSFKTESEALEYRAEMVALHYTHDPSKRD
tara:strand:- start:144 stop:635 length:492 start_codon:yes stop_codon:yes gene_type:complete